MDNKEPEKEQEEIIEEEAPQKESFASVEQMEKARTVSGNVFNDALAVLFDADNRLIPLCRSKDLAFSLIVAAVFVLVSTLLNRGLFLFGMMDSGISVFIGSIVLYFAGALSIYITVKFIAGKQATYREGMNIMSVTFIPVIVATILSFIFFFASPTLAAYIQWFGMTVAFLLLYNAFKNTYEITIRSSIYLIPIIFTILFIILRIVYNLLGL